MCGLDEGEMPVLFAFVLLCATRESMTVIVFQTPLSNNVPFISLLVSSFRLETCINVTSVAKAA